MLERFNFYDVYGYLLPGLLLSGLFWLPFGLISRQLPAQDISKALFLVVLAYIAGQLLQSLASKVLPSKFRDAKGVLRQPSSIVLDAGGDNVSAEFKTFSTEFKEVLAKNVLSAFGLTILGDTKQDLTNRDIAFMQGRAFLIRKDAAQYVEQFEGLYALMRGICCAFFLSTAYLLGWALSFHSNVKCLGLCIWFALVGGCAGLVIFSMVFLLLKSKQRQEWEAPLDRGIACCVLFLIVGTGYFLGTRRPLSNEFEFYLWIALPVTMAAGVRCIREYRKYAGLFATTVWRDFSALYRDLHMPSVGSN